jgi:hypothetical protein
MSPEREGRPEVSLGRLCAVAHLGPGPSVAAGRAVLAGLEVLHRRGLVHGGLDAGAVRIGDDGTVRLAGDGSGPEPAPELLAGRQRAEVGAAWEMVRTLLAASLVTPPAALRGLLDGPPPPVGAGTALAALEAAAGELAQPTGERRAAARLAELVEPLRRYGHGPARPTFGAAGASTVISAPAAPPRPAPPQGPPAHRRRRLVLAAVGAAALGAAIWIGRGSAGTAPPSTGGPPVAAAATPLPSAPPAPPIPAVPAVAPASAGVIAAVHLEPAAGPCLPAAVCALQLRVDLLPRTATTTVRALIEVLDRCTGARTEVAVAPMRVAPAAASARWSLRVRAGAGPAPALLALATVPARAASAPVLVAPFLPSC